MPESLSIEAIEAAHGMATGFMFLIVAVNAQLIILILETFDFEPDVWWWKLSSQILGILVMVLIATSLYRIMHYLMGIKPFHFLVRYTSLTTLPFWRRYKYPKRQSRTGTPG